jgi:hypothetical protein
VIVLIDGRPLASYARAYAADGRVFAAVDPLLTRLADRIWFDGNTLVVERGDRRVRVELAHGRARPLNAAYVPAGPILRALGASVRYERAEHRLVVTLSAHAVVASPTPFNAALPSVAPSTVFTPSPSPAPRATWTGSPTPRRTALPFPPPT